MSRNERFERLRAAMHRRFDGALGAETVDSVLEQVVRAPEEGVGVVQRALVERVAVEVLARQMSEETTAFPEPKNELRRDYQPYPLAVSVVGMECAA